MHHCFHFCLFAFYHISAAHQNPILIQTNESQGRRIKIKQKGMWALFLSEKENCFTFTITAFPGQADYFTVNLTNPWTPEIFLECHCVATKPTNSHGNWFGALWLACMFTTQSTLLKYFRRLQFSEFDR